MFSIVVDHHSYTNWYNLDYYAQKNMIYEHKNKYLIKGRTVWLILPGQNKNRFCKINNTFDIIDHLDACPLLKLTSHLAENWMKSQRFCEKH